MGHDRRATGFEYRAAGEGRPKKLRELLLRGGLRLGALCGDTTSSAGQQDQDPDARERYLSRQLWGSFIGLSLFILALLLN